MSSGRGTWADDPELLATFRAEVEERLASLTAGLLALETHRDQGRVVQGLFRDAHTVKGSARLMGVTGVVRLAHGVEDLLGLLRDGRVQVRTLHVDLLLAACDGIARALPGGELAAGDLEALVAALEQMAAGRPDVGVPGLPPAAVPVLPVLPVQRGPVAPRVTASVRVAAHRVHELVDAVGEVGLGARRVERATGRLVWLAAEQTRRAAVLREACARSDLPEEVGRALQAYTGAGEQVTEAVRALRDVVDGTAGGLAQVRDGAVGLALVPVRRALAALPRLVRDVARSGGKLVDLVLVGEDVEIDTQVLDAVTGALTQLVINAVDHGCRPPAERRAAGRPERCTVTVRASSAAGRVVLEVADDGAGIDEAAVLARAHERGLVPAGALLTGPPLLALLFRPGLSTAATVTDTSGRGVGLDAVAAAVEDLGGSVEVHTGSGTSFVLTLPVTPGVRRCLLVRVGEERSAIAVADVVGSVSLHGAGSAAVHDLAGAPVLLREGGPVPLLDLAAALGAVSAASPRAAVVVRHARTVVAWAVDRLDLRGLAAAGAAPPRLPAAPTVRRPRVLVVEGSVSVRELERTVLEAAGYDVETAVDGLDGAARLRGTPTDLVLSAVELPGMDGFDLTRLLRRTPGWVDVPVVIMTSRGDDGAQQAGLEAGCSAYLLKDDVDQAALVATVRGLVGR